MQAMEILNSAIVTLVLKMKEIVILMTSVKIVLHADQTIAHLLLVLTLKLIVAIIIQYQLLEMKIFVQPVILVGIIKEIVILMMSVLMVMVVGAVYPVLDSIQI